MTLRSVWPSKNSPHTITEPNWSCWTILQAAQCSLQRLQTLLYLSHVLSEPVLICKENRAPEVNLQILVFSRECQSSCMVLSCEHRSHWRALCPLATFMESVSDSLVRNMHTSSMLGVILDCGCAPPVPPHTKEQILVLLLAWCPSMALSSSPRVTAGLLVSHTCSWECAGRHRKPLCDHIYCFRHPERAKLPVQPWDTGRQN